MGRAFFCQFPLDGIAVGEGGFETVEKVWHCFLAPLATVKDMPLRDVAEAGGWRDPNTLLKCYQQTDEATMTRVVLEPGKLREA